jgi:hypothetical protein
MFWRPRTRVVEPEFSWLSWTRLLSSDGKSAFLDDVSRRAALLCTATECFITLSLHIDPSAFTSWLDTVYCSL